MSGVLRKKSVLTALAAVLAASLLVWIPLIGRYSLEDPVPVAVHPAHINEDPQPWLGRRVQVEGAVRRIFGPRAFALEPQGDTGPLPGKSLLIVGGKPWTLLQRNPQVNELVRNDHVQVMGRVRKFSLEEFQESAGRHASDSLLAKWEGRPALVAQDLELTPGVPDLFPGSQQGRGYGGSGGDSASPAGPEEPLLADTAFGMP